MKSRALLIGLGSLIFLAIGSDYYFRRHFVQQVGLPFEKSRQPAFISGSPNLIDPCQNFLSIVCQKNTAETFDPTGSVRPDITGEMQALRIYEEIIHKHPNWSIEQVEDRLVQKIYTPQQVKLLRDVFQWVQNTEINLISTQLINVFSAKEKLELIGRIKNVSLELPPPAAVYSDEPDLYTKNDVYYERLPTGKVRLRVGGAYLFTAKSWFNRVFTFAHEIAHSIDPCELKSIPMQLPRGFERLTSCLMQQNIIQSPDQLSEAFADWMAVQVTTLALKKYSSTFNQTQLLQAAANSVRDLCDQDDTIRTLDTSLHLTPETRIEKIFGRNPEIRALLKCETTPISEVSYCDFNWRSTISNQEGSK